MESLHKYLLLGLMMLVFTACPPLCEMQYIDLGTLSDEVREMVPYKDGVSYGFRHSAGKEIYFIAHRDTSRITEFWDACTQLSYGSDHTLMTSDYPIFDIQFWIYKTDNQSVYHSASIGNVSFALPLTEDYQSDRFSFFDSLYIKDKWFSNVYEIIPVQSDQNQPWDILADSLWYNTEYGILKFTMSSGEYFEFIQ